MMTDEEVKKELLDKIDYMIANVNQWSVRDTLKHFTNYGFWEGDEMAIINPEIAKKIATELYNYVDFLKPGDPSIDEVMTIYIDIRKKNPTYFKLGFITTFTKTLYNY
jgi:hypothetical protein